MIESEMIIPVTGGCTYRASSLHSFLDAASDSGDSAAAVDRGETEQLAGQTLAVRALDGGVTIREVEVDIAPRGASLIAELHILERSLNLEDDAEVSASPIKRLSDLPVGVLGTSRAIVSLTGTAECLR